jgi:hypothetical protein
MDLVPGILVGITIGVTIAALCYGVDRGAHALFRYLLRGRRNRDSGEDPSSQESP